MPLVAVARGQAVCGSASVELPVPDAEDQDVGQPQHGAREQERVTAGVASVEQEAREQDQRDQRREADEPDEADDQGAQRDD